MKCEWPDCTKRARVQTSISWNSPVHRFCFRHTFMLVKSQIKRLRDYDFGIFMQPVIVDPPRHEISAEARPYVITPEDRAKEREDNAQMADEAKDTWNF